VRDCSQVNSLDAALETAILEKLERVAEVLAEDREVMNAKEAADFLRMPYSEFKSIAPSLPRHALSERRFVYTRKELLVWMLTR
jgi:hypothetical protein